MNNIEATKIWFSASLFVLIIECEVILQYFWEILKHCIRIACDVSGQIYLTKFVYFMILLTHHTVITHSNPYCIVPHKCVFAYNELWFGVPLMICDVVVSLEPNPLLSFRQESIAARFSFTILHHCREQKAFSSSFKINNIIIQTNQHSLKQMYLYTVFQRPCKSSKSTSLHFLFRKVKDIVEKLFYFT